MGMTPGSAEYLAAVAQDKKIWSDGVSHFIETTDFNSSTKTLYPKGTELTVYDKTNKVTKAFYFASKEEYWIKYASE